MKKLIMFFLCLALLCSLASCSMICQHRDEDDNGICDKCETEYSDGVDGTVYLCQHRDLDDDTHCDKCSAFYSDGMDILTLVPVHSHTYSAWAQYGNDATVTCDGQLFSRICSDCGNIEWKYGGYENHDFTTVTVAPTCDADGYDENTCTKCSYTEKVNHVSARHNLGTEYSYDKSFHWFACSACGAKESYAEHVTDDSGCCITCGQPLFETEGIIYDISQDGTYAEVIGYEGTATRVLIASEYQGLPVKSIYNEAFNNSNITAVTIPDSVTTIGSSAFYNCYSLASVVIPNSVTTIGVDAFCWCYNLAAVYINSIESWCNIGLYDYDSNPLYYAHNLYLNGELVKELIIPDSVTTIGSYAFYECSSLTSVVIGDSVTTIGKSAFNNCYNLTSVVIGDSVTTIGENAFFNCNSAIYTEYNYGKYIGDENNPYAVLIELTNKNQSTYTINENTQVIAYGVFRECARLTSITIPDSVTTIGDSAFSYCYSLTSVVIPDSVTTIGYDAFCGCSSLTSVVIGDSVEYIGDYAFCWCSNLTSVVIPNSIEFIGDGVFYEGVPLNTVYYCGTAEDWAKISIDSFGNDNLTDATRYYYSETAPTASGNYWHYDADGNVVIW